MRKVTYLRSMLLLPFAVSLLTYVMWGGGADGAFVLAILGSMELGVLPLIATVCILLYISVRSTLDSFEKWWLLSPFLMALVCIIFAFVLLLYQGLGNGFAWSNLVPQFAVAMLLGMCSVVVGYAYVVPAAVIGFLLGKAGLVLTPAPARLPL